MVSVYVDFLFLGLRWAVHHEGMAWQRKTAHLMAARKQREGEYLP
jgi:hypothetical protein